MQVVANATGITNTNITQKDIFGEMMMGKRNQISSKMSTDTKELQDNSALELENIR